MDLENQRRVKELVDKYGAENVVVVLGGGEAKLPVSSRNRNSW